MIRQTEFYGVVAIAVIFLLLIAFSQRDEPSHVRPIRISRDDYYEELSEMHNSGNNQSSTATIEQIVKLQQKFIDKSLWDYQFPKNKSIKDYLMNESGQPIRSVVITTWRSGSTFLGEVLDTVPGTYYHYEPLLHYGVVQIRGPPESDGAIATLKQLFNCDYSNLDRYLEYGKAFNYLFTHNQRLWDICETFPHVCFNPEFLSPFCKLFPFQSSKTVRLRLSLAEELLKDESLNVKVLYMVRDPRGTMQSRKHRVWCPGQPDCDTPSALCGDLTSDYKASVYLSKKYPNRFRAIRYEDLSFDPYNQVEEIFQFFGLYMHPKVSAFLDSHTKKNYGGVSSTFRDSKSAPLHWRFDLAYDEVLDIEKNCEQAMKLWGYIKSHNETHMRKFNPLGSYTLIDENQRYNRK